MERPLIPSQLQGKFETHFPGYWNWYLRIISWWDSLFDVNDNSIKPVHLTDAAAKNDRVYYSTTASKMAYKDASGTVHYFW